jgi:hypothetical protein
VIGGDGGSGPIASTEVFDPESELIEAGPDLPEARSRHGAAPLGDPASPQAILVAGGLGATLAPLAEALVLRTGESPAVFVSAGNLLPAAFDPIVLALGDGNAIVLGGFTALSGSEGTDPSKEAALFAFDGASLSREFIDLPDFDFAKGAGGAAGAVRSGSTLGSEGTGTSVVLAGGRSASTARAVSIYNPYSAAAARDHDLTRSVGPRRALVGSSLIGIFGVVERIREYYGDRHRSIELRRTEDPVLGTVITGKIGEWGVHLEIDGGLIHGEVAGKGFTVWTQGDRLRGDGVTVDLASSPDDSVDGRYYLSWKRNSVLAQLWRIHGDQSFNGRIGPSDRNVAIDVDSEGTRTDGGHSWFDSTGLGLEGSR